MKKCNRNLMIVMLAFFCTQEVFLQGIESPKLIFGSSVDFGLPYKELSNIGASIQSEYLFDKSFGFGIEFSSLHFYGQNIDNLNEYIDFRVVAPVGYIAWHTSSQNNFNFFISFGMGYPIIKGKYHGSTFILTSLPGRIFLIPHAKAGIRMRVSNTTALRANIGFYRIASVGIEYFI